MQLHLKHFTLISIKAGLDPLLAVLAQLEQGAKDESNLKYMYTYM